MEIEFSTTALKKQYEESAKAAMAYGPQVARKYIQRINILKAAKAQADIMAQESLRCHRLKGKLKRHHSIRLVDRWRLIVTFKGSALQVVRIEEVSNHYGD